MIERKDDFSQLLLAIQSGSTPEVFAGLLREAAAKKLLPNLLTRHTVMWEQTLTHLAVHHDRYFLLKLLIEAHADPNLTDANGSTTLHYAMYGRKEMTTLLLGAQADPNVLNHQGIAPIHLVIRHRNEEALELVKQLVEAKADLNLANKQNLCTPLHYAVSASISGKNQILTWLLEAKAHPNPQDAKRYTPLSMIGCRGVDTIKILIMGKADVNLANELEETAVHAVARFGGPERMSLLLCNKAMLQSNDQGETPLHIAINYMSWDLIPDLLGSDIDLDAIDQYGDTALHRCVLLSSEYSIVLLNAGANPNITNGEKKTPLVSFLEYIFSPNLKFKKMWQSCIENTAELVYLFLTIDINSMTKLNKQIACTFVQNQPESSLKSVLLGIFTEAGVGETYSKNKQQKKLRMYGVQQSLRPRAWGKQDFQPITSFLKNVFFTPYTPKRSQLQYDEKDEGRIVENRQTTSASSSSSSSSVSPN